MRVAKHLLNCALAACLLATLGCADGPIDDGDSADVFLTMQTLNIPPVTAGTDAVTGSCLLTVMDATATFQNNQKNQFATSPFNDVVLESVTITYTWDDTALSSPPRTFSLSGTIPAGGAGDVTFQPIALGDIGPGFDGHSANMDMLFTGRTAAGGDVTTPAGGLLTVDSCP